MKYIWTDALRYRTLMAVRDGTDVYADIPPQERQEVAEQIKLGMDSQCPFHLFLVSMPNFGVQKVLSMTPYATVVNSYPDADVATAVKLTNEAFAHDPSWDGAVWIA